MIRIFILSFVLVFGSMDCATNKYTNYKLTKELIELKAFELNERLDVLEDFMKIFPRPVESLGKINESKI